MNGRERIREGERKVKRGRERTKECELVCMCLELIFREYILVTWGYSCNSMGSYMYLVTHVHR